MDVSVDRPRVAPRASTASVIAGLSVLESESDGLRVAVPRAEIQIVARFGPSARGGLDVHALGARQSVHRKLIRRGQRAVTAHLRLGTSEAVLGVPASAVAGRIVALEELWGDAAIERLRGQLAAVRDTAGAAGVLERAILERLALAGARGASGSLAREAAERLTSASVSAVADDLGVSERHLRRVFREAAGVGPKAFAKLTRFHRALRAAREGGPAQWAGIAAAAGYYDQAHLIAEFRAISGVTPRAFIEELRAEPSLV